MTRVPRVLGVLLAVSLVSGGPLLARGRAAALAYTARAGDLLATLAARHGFDAPRTLQLNGMTLHLSVGTTRERIASVLDELRKPCAFDLHESHDALGQLVCLQNDLAILFVRAQRSDDGSTFLVRVWSDTALPLRAAFPATGDAPGTDVAGMPRPAQARRVLSAALEGHASLIDIYSVAADAAGTRRSYAATLEAAGFRLLEAPQPALAARYAFLARRRDRDVFVVIAAEPSARSVVLVAPL